MCQEHDAAKVPTLLFGPSTKSVPQPKFSTISKTIDTKGKILFLSNHRRQVKLVNLDTCLFSFAHLSSLYSALTPATMGIESPWTPVDCRGEQTVMRCQVSLLLLLVLIHGIRDGRLLGTMMLVHSCGW